MPNYNYNMFQRNQRKNVKKSFKDLSHEWKHDFSPGNLIPCLAIQTLPGDEFEISSQLFFEFDPLYYPIIHHMGVDVDYFWIRNATMWPWYGDGDEGWEDFITLRAEVAHPTVDVVMEDFPSSEISNNSIYGYLGVPYLKAGAGRSTTITALNAFPAMAYYMIYKQYYAHPQLEDTDVQIKLHAGDNTANLIDLFGYDTPTSVRLQVFPAKWAKDYFTSCLPTPQQGDPVLIPSVEDGFPKESTQWKKSSDGSLAPDGDVVVDTGGSGEDGGTMVSGTKVYHEHTATIRQFSFAVVLQTIKEQLMKFGNRYKDWVEASHDVDVDPLDMDIPIMIGSFRGKVEVSTQMAQANFYNDVNSESQFTGDYVGNARLFDQGRTIKYICRDYGILMCIFSLTPNTGYGQGIPRWLRYSDPFDYPMDIFQGVGDQEILKEEVMYNNVTAEAAKNQETFGYGVRYQEAFTIPNNYGSGLAFRAGLSKHLGKWYDPDTTTGALYDQLITINREFVDAGDTAGASGPGGIRVRDVFRVLTTPLATPSDNSVTGYIYHKIGAMRPLAAYSTPSLGM